MLSQWIFHDSHVDLLDSFPEVFGGLPFNRNDCPAE